MHESGQKILAVVAKVRFSRHFDLRNFPFDQHLLPVKIVNKMFVEEEGERSNPAVVFVRDYLNPSVLVNKNMPSSKNSASDFPNNVNDNSN